MENNRTKRKDEVLGVLSLVFFIIAICGIFVGSTYNKPQHYDLPIHNFEFDDWAEERGDENTDYYDKVGAQVIAWDAFVDEQEDAFEEELSAWKLENKVGWGMSLLGGVLFFSLFFKSEEEKAQYIRDSFEWVYVFNGKTYISKDRATGNSTSGLFHASAATQYAFEEKGTNTIVNMAPGTFTEQQIPINTGKL